MYQPAPTKSPRMTKTVVQKAIQPPPAQPPTQTQPPQHQHMAHPQTHPQQSIPPHPQAPVQQLQKPQQRPVLPGGGIPSQQTPTPPVPITKPSPSPSASSSISKNVAGPSKEGPSSVAPVKGGDAQRTKRPMNAFLIFSGERRPQLQKADPRLTTADLSKKLGNEWKRMEAEKKDRYVEKAKLLKEEFTNNNPGYKYSRRSNSTHKHKRSGKSASSSSVSSASVSSGRSASYTQSPGGKGRGAPVGKSKRDRKLKRPMNAFLLYNKEMRPKVLQKNPNMTVAEISKTIGDSWRSMPGDQRENYLQLARQIKDEFHTNNPDFVYTRRSKAELAAAGLSSTKKRNYNEESSAEEDTRPRRKRHDDGTHHKDPRGRKKKRARHPTAPKHPMSGFLFYASDVRPEITQENPGKTVGFISQIIAKKWRALTPEEKSPWEQKASADKARYAKEMETYLQSQKSEE
ncbi:11526_t:CDS:2 [Paraglomus brasilianum]|uniref:11526_t:CDS:1 n=1 Tax=Paraglomus brasilianum TaxID=144538 RepID=A0A9N8VT73_9GLOM|nr:11526_t:CDS:2 [Paraglomus brasilianum]